MAKAKPFQSQREYEKWYTKVEKRIGKLEKEGYTFDPKQLPKELERANKKSVENIKSYTEKKLKNLSKTTYTTEEGEIVSGKEGAKIQASERAKKGWEKRKKDGTLPPHPEGWYILEELRRISIEALERYGYDKGVQERCEYYDNLLNRLESEDGFYSRLEQMNREELFTVASNATTYYGYNDEAGWTAMNELESILTNRALTLGDLVKRQQKMDERDFYEAESDEPLPFW